MDEIDRIARRQWGLITTAQVLTQVSKAKLLTCVSHGWLIPVHRSVYRISGSPVTWQQTLLAAQLACGKAAVASHLSAARLHGLRVRFDNASHITVAPTASTKRIRHFRLHRSPLQPTETVTVDRIPTTSLHRTFFDLAGLLSRRDLAYVLDETVIHRKTTFLAMQNYLDLYATRGRSGVANLRLILRTRIPFTRIIRERH